MMRFHSLAPARCCANNLLQQTVSSGFFQHPGALLNNWRISATYSAQTHAPSSCEAAATGARSFSAIAARSVPCAPALLPSLTPARWPAKMIVGQTFGFNRVRGVVLSENAREHAKERLSLCDCSAISPVLAVPDFWEDTHMRAHTRAYMCEAKQRTREHSINLYRLQRVGCSFVVLSVFSPRTRQAVAIGQLGARHILAGGYARGAGAGARVGRIRGQNLGRVARSFRVFGGAVSQLLELGAVGGNGGNQPFLQGSSGHVGRAELEGWGQGAVSSALSGARRKPGRLRAHPGGLDRRGAQATPLCPHSPAADPLSCWRARLAGFGSGVGRIGARAAALNVSADQARRWLRGANVGAGLTGRGGVLGSTLAAMAATGRGGAVFSGLSGTAPGWICDAKAGGARVN